MMLGYLILFIFFPRKTMEMLVLHIIAPMYPPLKLSLNVAPITKEW